MWYGYTKEYVLTEMTLGQFILFYHYGAELKYPKEPKQKTAMRPNITPEQIMAKANKKAQFGKPEHTKDM